MSTQHAAVERVHPPRWLINHLVNPVARKMLRHDGKIGDEILLLRFDGRKTGHRYEIPISYRRIGDKLALFTTSTWRHNFHGGRAVEVVLHGEEVAARASLMDDPDEVAEIYGELIDEVGMKDVSRRLGIKVYVDRKPTTAELAEMVRASGLSIVWLEPAT